MKPQFKSQDFQTAAVNAGAIDNHGNVAPAAGAAEIDLPREPEDI